MAEEPPFQSINFTVDARLLDELGSRLVAKPSIALAELVKNAYDADATRAEIVFDPQGDRIIVRDDGHGMTREGVRAFWMRVGTTHKRDEKSLLFGRRLTGSKGIGRLSVQFLAHRLRMITVPHPRLRKDDPPYWIETRVDWRRAIRAGDLTNATAEYRERRTAPPQPHGTELLLTELKKTDWSRKELRELAKEIWWLQPPFKSFVESLPEHERFEIQFKGPVDFTREFEEQMQAIERIQTARLLGRVRNGQAHVILEFWKRGQSYEKHHIEYHVADLPGNDGRYVPETNLHDSDFEIRIYKLKGRQPEGIRVSDLREYLDRFAGVHVYDGGFRLPFYGDPSNDWLLVEYDHAHRMFESRLLPKEIQEAFKHTQRLRYLPTLRRIIGLVRVDTSAEPGLEISITRDRLVENRAHEDLRLVVRYALDWYAYHEALRAYLESEKDRSVKAPLPLLRDLKETLLDYEEVIPKEVRTALEERIRTLEISLRAERGAEESRMALLGPLATAGITAVVIQHEMRKQFRWLEGIRNRLESLALARQDEELSATARELGRWVERAQDTNSLFDFLSAEAMEGPGKRKRRYPARMIVEQMLEQVAFFAQGVEISLERLPQDLLLPPASYAEWGAIFQNVFVNAFNAMRSTRRRVLHVSARVQDKHRTLLVQDTGVGVDLKRASQFFEPFVRGIDLEPRSARLGFGGTGLGLTIVKLVAEHIGCEVGFVEPEEGFATAFALTWQEVK